MRRVGARRIHQRLAVTAAFAQQPAALHQVVGLQYELALFEQCGLEAFDLVEESDEVERDVAHQLELGADARQFGIGRVPHLHKLVFEVNVQLTAQKFPELGMDEKVAGVLAYKAARIAGQQDGA